MAMTVRGSCSGGLTITALPVASAAAAFSANSSTGKLNGKMAATTPSGALRTHAMSSAVDSIVSVGSGVLPRDKSLSALPRVIAAASFISNRACTRILPLSSARSRDQFPASSSTRAAARCKISARSPARRAAQADCAATAFEIVLETRSAEATGTDASSRRVAGARTRSNSRFEMVVDAVIALSIPIQFPITSGSMLV